MVSETDYNYYRRNWPRRLILTLLTLQRVIIKLAFAGTIDAFDIDTSYFNGNHPPSANVEGCHSPDKDPAPGDDTFVSLPQPVVIKYPVNQGVFFKLEYIFYSGTRYCLEST